MKSFVEIDKEKNGIYLKLLSAISRLSGLFSENSIPFINYRVVENIFCKSFDAKNLSRSDTAFDASYNSIGVGIKTFTCSSDNSMEKIAEFNSLSQTLSKWNGQELAIKLGEFRNERIKLAKRLYAIENSIYHIVVRKEKELLFYETDYNLINIDKINCVKENKASLKFQDNNNSYSFNYSKNTLYHKFFIPQNTFRLPIEIIEDPYALLLELFENKALELAKARLIKGENYIVLPLYGVKNKQKFVFQKSGLNQWNASGRKRDMGEIYIPIPIHIHKQYPYFFPKRDTHFNLSIPTKEVFQTKICQDNSKALMTSPNNALSDWLLRKIFGLNQGELATIEKMNELGFDSVMIQKDQEGAYQIDKAKSGSYEKFITR